MENTEKMYAVIGAGPCGLSMARNLAKKNIPFVGFEYHKDVGGIWNQDNPMSTMYDSAHLISSKTMTQYDEFPFENDVADFPHQKRLKEYFQGFAGKFKLYDHYRFNTEITKLEPTKDKKMWNVTFVDRDTKEEQTKLFKGVIIATGLFNKGNENIPKWEGVETFNGEILHSSNYRSSDIFADKKVLIVGCGNSAADICVDAVHRAEQVDISVRRGYYFVPKYIFGKPMDTVNGAFKKFLPEFIKRPIDKKILKWFAGDPTRFGFPKPEYDLFESHPVINSYLLQHIGHGDINIKRDISFFKGNTVHFKDGDEQEYDVVLLATGYHLKYDFIKKEHLNWQNACPKLYLNVFSPEYDNLFVLGMIEATGIGWQGRYDQSELVATYINNKDSNNTTDAFNRFEEERKENTTDLSNGMKYIKLDRMAYYVHKEHYMGLVKERISELSQ